MSGRGGRPRRSAIPTANLRLHEEKLVPLDGVYAAWARIGGAGEWLPAAMSIGVRPTFDGSTRALEAHLLDWQGELPGRDLEVELVDWIRPAGALRGPRGAGGADGARRRGDPPPAGRRTPAGVPAIGPDAPAGARRGLCIGARRW